ncbi:hypothetical protein [Afipia broomeae]|nr:hypothetical protein [Afipia broomeae]
MMRASGEWPWIPGSREAARPGMTAENVERFNTFDVVPATAGTNNHRISW